MHRTLVESKLYTEQYRALGDVKRLDDLLSGLLWSLSTAAHPEEWPIVPGFRALRIAKTDGFDTPVLRIWFVLNEQTVDLLAIEAEPDEQ